MPRMRKAKNDKKILIVFDDLWEKLDLEAIGIPSDMQRSRGCKILLTSRNVDVLKYGMNCQKYFRVGTLDKDEAWSLFQKMAGSFENDDRQSTAEEVAEMCTGLPLAIVTVASTLRDKSLQEWKDALQRLKRPNFEDPSEQTAIYKIIKLSYDYLRTDELRSFFLLCSQMGYRATTKDLLKYGIGRSLFGNVSKLNEARDRVFSLVQELKAKCLLLEGETSEELVMHDVVREVGRWISASREHNVLIVNDENQMKQLVDHEDKLKTYSEMWLSSNFDELPEEIKCPKLALFHVDSKNPNLKIPNKLFLGMRQLTTLSFSGLSFTSLSSSLDSLENLKTLCVHESPELGDVSMVEKLRRLEVLSFVKSMIKHLPIEIGELSKLKLLDLSDRNKLRVIPPSVLPKLSQLEGLHMSNSFDVWGSSEGGVTSANVSELKQLTSLTSLDIGIRDAHPISTCREIFSNKKLCTYRISIGDFSWENGGNKTSKALKLKFTDDTNDVGMEELGVMELLKESEEVCFDGLKLEALVPGEPFRKLKFIKVSSCTRLKYLFSFFVAQGLSQLLKIEVEGCDKIEEIVAEEEASVNQSGACTNKNIVFSQLQSLSLIALPKFKSFCSKEKLEDPSSTQSQFSMTSIPVFDEWILFPNLKELFLRAIACEVLWSGHLQLPTIEIPFQKLIELRVTHCYGLKYLFPAMLVKCLGGLKKLEIEACDSMEEVVLLVGRMEEQIVFPSLKELSIGFCPALKSFTSSTCEEEILEDENAKQKRPFFDEMVVFPTLIVLNIIRINIDKIWHRQLAPHSFCKLRELRIRICDNLRNIFSSNSVEMRRFQNLENMTVQTCASLEVIFEVDDDGWTRESNHGHRTVLPISFHFKVLELSFLPKLRHIWSKDPSPPGGRGTDPYDFSNLQSVLVVTCNALENVFPCSIATHLPKLEYLDIFDCDEIEEIVAKGEEINNDNAAAAPCFRFPELTTVMLCQVRKLRTWYPVKHTLEFPKLKVWATRGNYFAAALLSLSHQKAMSNLEELKLNGDSISHPMMKWKEFIQPNLFPRLKLLTLFGFEHVWAGLPTDFLQELHSLKELSVWYCGFEQLFIGCDCEHICGWEHKDTHVHVSPLLRNLTTLQVSDCDSLITLLFTNPESAKSLTDDQQEEKEITSTTITFPNLHCLELVNLKNLTCFCSGNYNLNFHSLDQVVVQNCPKMRIFSPPKVQLSTPKLQHVVYGDGYFTKEKHWEGNLNATIQKLFTVGWVDESDDESGDEFHDLKLSEFPQPGNLNDQENLTQNENSSTAKDFENGSFFQEQKSPRAIHQDETIPPSSIEQSLTIPAAAVAQKVSPSASTSATKTSHSQPGKSLIDNETCILPQTKEENPTQNQNSSTAKDIESGTFLQAEKGPQASDQSTVQSVPAAAAAVTPKVSSLSSATKTPHSQPVKCLIDTETCILPQTKESKPLQDQAMTSSMIENSGNIPVSMAMMKYIVTKDLSDVATSDDAIFLLSALKTLKDCPSFTPEELAIIELYIKNFDSLETNYPFHKHQLGRASALKSSSMEDDKKGNIDLKMEYDEVASEANTLCAEKEALKKRLLEIEDREGKVLEKKGNLYGQLLKGKPETLMNALKEAARLENEAEDRISNANHQWLKMRSLFP